MKLSAIIASLICILGVGAVAVLTAITGFDYWMQRGDPFGAWLTAAFEIVAFGGLGAAAAHRGKFSWALWLLAVLLTLAAAAWCGFTQYERLKTESRAHVVAAIKSTEVYRMAREDWESARRDADGWRGGDLRPTCACPDTIRAWQATHAAEATRLESIVTERQARMTALIPAPSIDPIAAARGLVIELLKLLGFVAFSGALRHVFGRRRELEPETPLKHWALRGDELDWPKLDSAVLRDMMQGGYSLGKRTRDELERRGELAPPPKRRLTRRKKR